MVNLRQIFNNGWQAGAAFLALFLMVGHWFPWPYFLKARKLPRIPAYVYGSFGVWTGFAAWRGLRAPETVGLMALYAVGFVATCVAYLIDEAAKVTAGKLIK